MAAAPEGFQSPLQTFDDFAALGRFLVLKTPPRATSNDFHGVLRLTNIGRLSCRSDLEVSSRPLVRDVWGELNADAAL